MGFQREGAATVYREWAPAAQSAQLIGDFNGWNGDAMQRDQFGVWSVRLPDGIKISSLISTAPKHIAINSP